MYSVFPSFKSNIKVWAELYVCVGLTLTFVTHPVWSSLWAPYPERTYSINSERKREKHRTTQRGLTIQIVPTCVNWIVIGCSLTPSSCDSGLFTTRSCCPAALRGFVMCCRQTVTTESQTPPNTHRTMDTHMYTHTVSLIFSYCALSSLVRLIHWFLSSGSTSR